MSETDLVAINVAEWPRFPEVKQYAEDHQLTLDEAIRRLVNSGLSHA